MKKREPSEEKEKSVLSSWENSAYAEDNVLCDVLCLHGFVSGVLGLLDGISWGTYGIAFWSVGYCLAVSMYYFVGLDFEFSRMLRKLHARVVFFLVVVIYLLVFLIKLWKSLCV